MSESTPTIPPGDPDWNKRLSAIRELTREKRWEDARRLVREAPDGPVPYQIQRALWSLLSPAASITVHGPDESTSPGRPKLTAKARLARSVQRFRSSPGRPLVDRPKPAPASLRFSQPEGGAGRRSLSVTPLRRDELPVPAESHAGSSRVSAFSAALMAHFLILIAFSLAVWQVPIPSPPQITVRPAPEPDPEVPRQRIVREVPDPKPSAPAPAPPEIVTSLTESAVAIPTVKDARSPFASEVFLPDLGPSMGFSDAGQGAESAVTFFGIQGGGQRIAIIADTTPHMLLDEKGGMFAYDKVKNEIAALLGALQNRTAFNLILYENARLTMFRPEPVRALHSSVSQALRFLEPVNRDYGALGLSDAIGSPVDVRPGAEPIHHAEIAHYAKAIQLALEQDVDAVFCITSGWREMSRRLSPEDQARLEEAQQRRREAINGMELTYDEREVEAWKEAQEKAREWLRRENQARRERGLPPKVVLNMGPIIQQVAPGARPPRPKEDLPPLDVEIDRLPPYTREDVEDHIKGLIEANYGKNKPDQPQIHIVLFLGEEEELDDEDRDHFRRLTRRNRGDLKILRGLEALENVTGFR